MPHDRSVCWGWYLMSEQTRSDEPGMDLRAHAARILAAARHDNGLAVQMARYSNEDVARLAEHVMDLGDRLSAAEAQVADLQAQRGLTFADLSAANQQRCGRWHPGFPDDETWTGSDWSNALGGEAGELAEAALAIVAAAGKVQNTVKKIRRYETGTNTAVDKPMDALLAELDAEMADVACYLDLLATKYGRDLAGAIVAKFNAVSERQGFPERLAALAPVPPPEALAKCEHGWTQPHNELTGPGQLTAVRCAGPVPPQPETATEPTCEHLCSGAHWTRERGVDGWCPGPVSPETSKEQQP